MLTGLVVNAVALQIVAVCAGISGFGFTVTTTVNVAPGQLPDNGVTVYVAVCATFVILVNVPDIEDCPVPVAPPVKPPVTTGKGQEYVVPAAMIFPFPVTGVTVKVLPLQTGVVSLATVGFGLTVTVMMNLAPRQVPAAPDTGVTVYTTV